MKMNQNKFKPSVDKRSLLLLAGCMWLIIGTILISISYSWLNFSQDSLSFVFVGIGTVIALIIHHFGFLKIVNENLDRILSMEGKRCVFSFMPLKSYILVLIMIILGAVLRDSPIPKNYLSILYHSIGLALILSSVRYLRIFLQQLKI